MQLWRVGDAAASMGEELRDGEMEFNIDLYLDIWSISSFCQEINLLLLLDYNDY